MIYIYNGSGQQNGQIPTTNTRRPVHVNDYAANTVPSTMASMWRKQWQVQWPVQWHGHQPARWEMAVCTDGLGAGGLGGWGLVNPSKAPRVCF